jgi:phenylacetate-CoA ligase
MNNRKKIVAFIKGIAGAYVAYPIAEKVEKREITTKVNELKKYYSIPFEQRKIMSFNKLVEILDFANSAVPYYKDLFKSIKFNPASLYDY